MTSKKKFLVLFSFIMGSYGFVYTIMQAILYDVQTMYGANAEIMGFSVAAMCAMQFIFPILFGVVADKKGKVPVLKIFIAVAFAGCILCAASNSLAMYVAGTLVTGTGCTMIESMVVSLLPDIDEERNTQNGNLVQVIFAFAAGMAPIIISILAMINISWRAGFLAIAVVYIGIFTAVCRSKFPKSRLMENADAPAKIEFKELLKPLFVVLFICMCIYMIMEASFAFFIDSLSTQKGNGNTGAYALACFWFGMAISRGYIASRKEVDEMKVIRICYLIAAITIAAVTLSSNAVLSIILCLLAGIAFGPTWPTIVAFAGKKYKGSASLISLVVAGGSLGGIIGPAITGSVSEHVSMQAAFIILAAFALAGAGITLAVKKQ